MTLYGYIKAVHNRINSFNLEYEENYPYPTDEQVEHYFNKGIHQRQCANDWINGQYCK